MEKPPPIIPEKIHLQAIEVAAFRLDAERLVQTPKQQLTLGHKLLHNLAEHKLKLELVFSFKDDEEREVLFLQIDFYFMVDNLPDFYKTGDDGSPVFFAPAMGTFLAIAVSTSRGIIFEKLRSSGIPGSIIIPVLDPHKLLQDSN
ncbi:MAG: hypothetical protein JJU35_15215 [Balneolales bacterium]|nr:hypothetical protein [Balneolales bacterium]